MSSDFWDTIDVEELWWEDHLEDIPEEYWEEDDEC